MIRANTTLKEHLSNIIYIDNRFDLELFKPELLTEESDEDNDEIIVDRRNPESVQASTIKSDSQGEIRQITIEDFFRETQNNAENLNILPYFYESGKFWTNTDLLKNKLAHFPLIIIDWRLEEGENAKTGIDVFDEITQDTEILHYYVIYSNELAGAIESFKCKYPNIRIGTVSENNVAVVENAIVMFANKRTCNINSIIDTLANFTEENYGYLPQLFLGVKHQIEKSTAVLYNDFMGLDSMMLPQLIVDEVYDYEGMQEEVLLSLIVSKLRESLNIEETDDCYAKLALIKLLNTPFSEEAFDNAKKIVKKHPKDLTFNDFKDRIRKIVESDCIKTFDFDSLKSASQIYFSGNSEECYDKSWTEDKKNKKRKENIKNFILFLSICSDKDYYKKYVKLLSLIKFTEYKDQHRWLISDFPDAIKAKALCQGDVFIDDSSSSFLLCITPACQLIRPEKVKNTYTFLRGTFAKEETQRGQKQTYSMHLTNKEKSKVILVNWEFFDPIVFDFLNQETFEKFKTYQRCYRLNIEYVHKVVELYSEYIKQIGVEEVFGKCIDEKSFFVEMKEADNVGS